MGRQREEVLKMNQSKELEAEGSEPQGGETRGQGRPKHL